MLVAGLCDTLPPRAHSERLPPRTLLLPWPMAAPHILQGAGEDLVFRGVKPRTLQPDLLGGEPMGQSPWLV